MKPNGEHTAAYKVRVELSNSGWMKLRGMQCECGNRFIQAFLLRWELSEYLQRYNEAGVLLDTQCQELRFDEEICVLLRKVQGVWYVTDIWMIQMAVRFIPLFVWQKVRRGCREVAARILAGWQAVRFPRGEGELALQ